VGRAPGALGCQPRGDRRGIGSEREERRSSGLSSSSQAAGAAAGSGGPGRGKRPEGRARGGSRQGSRRVHGGRRLAGASGAASETRPFRPGSTSSSGGEAHTGGKGQALALLALLGTGTRGFKGQGSVLGLGSGSGRRAAGGPRLPLSAVVRQCNQEWFMAPLDGAEGAWGCRCCWARCWWLATGRPRTLRRSVACAPDGGTYPILT